MSIHMRRLLVVVLAAVVAAPVLAAAPAAAHRAEHHISSNAGDITDVENRRRAQPWISEPGHKGEGCVLFGLSEARSFTMRVAQVNGPGTVRIVERESDAVLYEATLENSHDARKRFWHEGPVTLSGGRTHLYLGGGMTNYLACVSRDNRNDVYEKGRGTGVFGDRESYGDLIWWHVEDVRPPGSADVEDVTVVPDGYGDVDCPTGAHMIGQCTAELDQTFEGWADFIAPGVPQHEWIRMETVAGRTYRVTVTGNTPVFYNPFSSAPCWVVDVDSLNFRHLDKDDLKWREDEANDCAKAGAVNATYQRVKINGIYALGLSGETAKIASNPNAHGEIVNMKFTATSIQTYVDVSFLGHNWNFGPYTVKYREV